MTEETLETYTYRILRYTPNLVRDEWVNIGVLLQSLAGGRLRVRLIDEDAGFARVRRLHREADVGLLRALQSDFESQIAAHEEDLPGFLANLEDTLSNVLQIGPKKAVLTRDFEAELDRLFHDHVEPPPYRAPGGAERESSRGMLRLRAREAFLRAGILGRFERGVRVAEFTTAGDPFKLDYAYRNNGARGYVHALPLGRGAAPARELAFTAECIRSRLPAAEFTAITEIPPQPGNDRHAFVAGLLESRRIALVAVAGLDKYAQELRAKLM